MRLDGKDCVITAIKPEKPQVKTNDLLVWVFDNQCKGDQTAKVWFVDAKDNSKAGENPLQKDCGLKVTVLEERLGSIACLVKKNVHGDTYVPFPYQTTPASRGIETGPEIEVLP